MGVTAADRAAQRKVSREFKTFRRRFLFSQVQLSEALGVSRRTVQYAESGKGGDPDWPCIPQPSTLLKFKQLKAKHEKEAKN